MLAYLIPFLGILESLTRLVGFGRDPFQDIVFALKIIIFLMIVGFVRGAIQNSMLQLILIAVIAYIVLIQNFAVFGGLYIVYIIMGFGVGHLIIDFIFVKNMGGGGAQKMGQAGMKLFKMPRLRR